MLDRLTEREKDLKASQDVVQELEKKIQKAENVALEEKDRASKAEDQLKDAQAEVGVVSNDSIGSSSHAFRFRVLNAVLNQEKSPKQSMKRRASK